jgi:16S rRNA (adenine1518-N6/adenine1519-N6)-dimethyltransferase
VEVDAGMLDFASSELRGAGNVELLLADALDGKGGLNPRVLERVRALGAFKLVANLPYSIATPLILAILESDLPVRGMLVTVQKELARRLGAPPDTRDYSPATVLLAFWATVEVLRTLPPGAFWPPPRVASAVTRIVPRPPLGTMDLYQPYGAWAHRLLSQRRKQVGKLLREALGTRGGEEALRLLGLEASRRPDTVTPEGFFLLARKWPTFEFDSTLRAP